MKRILLIFLAVLLIALSFYFDATVVTFFTVHRVHWLVQVAKWTSRYGDWFCLMLACAVCLWIAHRRRDEDRQRTILTMMIVGSLAGLAADALRVTTGRTRPNSETVQGWFGMKHDSRWLITDNRYKAFPSGHVATAMGLVAPLLLLRRRSGWLLLPLAVAIAASRIILGAHHLSDVIVGTLLAFGTAQWWLCHGPPALKPKP